MHKFYLFNIALHVTPVQYVAQGDTVQLICGMNITTATSKVLPDDIMIVWYDGFIPITAINNIHKMDGYEL